MNIRKIASEKNYQVHPDTIRRVGHRDQLYHPEQSDLESKGREKMAGAGVKLVVPAVEDRKKAQELAMPYWGEWAQSTGPKAVQALNQVRTAVKK